MTLSDDHLNAAARDILSYLQAEGRATPALLADVLADRDPKYCHSRGYLNQRLIRLSEHGHARNVRSAGLYEFVGWPD